ncbi:MAG TPA: hypothetical protein VFB45_09135 [Pseudolabrys sp.]|nr:hypothetical protein [Pseudolabrys sp.]
MRSIAILLLGAAAVLSTGSVAQAADGCGRGMYWNGYRCAPRYAGPPPYGGGYYQEGPRYYRGEGRFRTYNGCAPGWTVQDGQCKPYRGY